MGIVQVHSNQFADITFCRNLTTTHCLHVTEISLTFVNFVDNSHLRVTLKNSFHGVCSNIYIYIHILCADIYILYSNCLILFSVLLCLLFIATFLYFFFYISKHTLLTNIYANNCIIFSYP